MRVLWNRFSVQEIEGEGVSFDVRGEWGIGPALSISALQLDGREEWVRGEKEKAKGKNSSQAQDWMTHDYQPITNQPVIVE